jgi:deoxyribose-phosphate aldolase
MSDASVAAPPWNGPLPTVADVASMVDHSLLRPELTRADVETGLATAIRYRVASVCVRPSDVQLAARQLTGTDVLAGTVVGFPHGAHTAATKVRETSELIELGAREIDMVINIGRLRDHDVTYVQDEIAAIVGAADPYPVKVIFENAYLTQQQKVEGYRAAEAAGAAFIKTSTGFAAGGATADDIKLMRATVSENVQIKAAGGVRTLDALLYLNALGATRFGATATASILDDLEHRLAHGKPLTRGARLP